MAKGVAVIEGRWESRGNYGVRPMFEMISALNSRTCNPHEIRHDMFYEAKSLEFVLQAHARSGKVDTVYIGSHGTHDSINGVPRAALIGILQRINAKKRLSGMFVASCSFARPATVSALLDPQNATGLKWLAGYRKDVDWLESAAAEILFWSGYFDCEAERAVTRARNGAANVLNHMPGAGKQLGFGIFKWSADLGRPTSMMNQ